MKKLLGIIAVALLGTAMACQAANYANHFFNQRVYRVSLGSGTAPTAADMALIRLQNGEMVLNTDDNVLYIMHATNVYTKITAAGVVTMSSVDSTAIANATGRNRLVNAASINVTNGQVITLSATNAVVKLTGIGQADAYTNTITIATPYPVGYDILFCVASGSTNLVLIADSTTVLALGSDVALGPTDTLRIFTVATNEAVKISTSNN